MCGVGREETRTHKTPTHTVVVVDDPHHVAAVFLGLNCDELVGVSSVSVHWQYFKGSSHSTTHFSGNRIFVKERTGQFKKENKSNALPLSILSIYIYKLKIYQV